jgi:hypothetical protein
MPEFQAQQQQQMAAGFKHIQASHKTSARVVPEGLPMSPTSNVKKRCGWITSQSDAALIAYHDEEWGVPIYDERYAAPPTLLCSPFLLFPVSFEAIYFSIST